MQDENKVTVGFWENTSKKGMAYLSSSISGERLDKLIEFLQSAQAGNEKVRMVVFENTRKEQDKHPDRNLILSIEKPLPPRSADTQVERSPRGSVASDDDSSLPF